MKQSLEDMVFLGYDEGNINQFIATDYLLFRNCEEEYGSQLVHFYGFNQEGIILGVNQKNDVLLNGNSNLALNRRATGGGHVIADTNCLSYCFVCPTELIHGNLGIEDLRRKYANLIAETLQNLGLQNITVNDEESTVNYGNHVIASHAVRNAKGSFLLHGFLILDKYNEELVRDGIRFEGEKHSNQGYDLRDALLGIPSLKYISSEDFVSEFRKTANKNYSIRGEKLNGGIKKKLPATIELFERDSWKNYRRNIELVKDDYTPGEENVRGLINNFDYCFYSQVNPDRIRKILSKIQ